MFQSPPTSIAIWVIVGKLSSFMKHLSGLLQGMVPRLLSTWFQCILQSITGQVSWHTGKDPNQKSLKEDDLQNSKLMEIITWLCVGHTWIPGWNFINVDGNPINHNFDRNPSRLCHLQMSPHFSSHTTLKTQLFLWSKQLMVEKERRVLGRKWFFHLSPLEPKQRRAILEQLIKSRQRWQQLPDWSCGSNIKSYKTHNIWKVLSFQFNPLKLVIILVTCDQNPG